MADDQNLPLPNVPLGQAVVNAVSPDQSQAQQAEQGSTQGASTQPAAKAPKMGGQPLLYRYISQMIKGQAGGQPISRGDASLNFLGEFLGNLAGGLANAGHGPGANLRGFAGAVQAPYQRNLQDFQVQQQANQQQAQIQGEQARTALTQEQTAALGPQRAAQLAALTPRMRFDPTTGKPLEPMTDAQYQQYVKGQGAAQVNTQGRIDVETMKAKLAQGEVSRVLPTQDANGNKVMRAYNRYGKVIGDIDGALPPASYLPKTTSTNTIEYKQLDDGSIVGLPKPTTRTTQTALPGSSATAKGGGATGAPAGAPVAVKDAQGNPLIGKGAVTTSTRTMVETAPKVIDLVERIKGQINDLEKDGSLGPGMSRWNEFWSGKVGEDNPKFRAMMTNTGLLSTLMMRMHIGARGGQQIMQHFSDMIGAGHQSAANMRATLDQMEVYANDVKGATPLPANYGKANQGGTVQYQLGDKIYNIPAAQEKEFLKDKPAATKVPGAGR